MMTTQRNDTVSNNYAADTRVAPTPAGIANIPQDWTVKTISEIADVKTGPFGSSLHQRDYVDEGTPIITVEHLGERGVIHEGLPLVSESDRSRLASYRLKHGDIVFSRVGSVDRNSLISEKEDGWLFSGRLLRVRVTDKDACPAYLSYYFNSEPFKRRVRDVAVGQTMASLNTQILNSVSVVLPPLQEQRAIAETLSDVDELLGALDTLIAKKQDIKLGAMQRLLTGETRLPGFRDPWETKPIGGTLSFLATASHPRAATSENGQTVYIHYGDVHSQRRPLLDLDRARLPRIDPRLVKNIPAVQDGDLVMVDASEDLEGVGKSVEVHGVGNRSVVAGLHTILCRSNPDHWAFGYKSYLQFTPAFKSALVRAATGTSVYGITKNQLANVEIPLPPPAEQQAITTILNDIDTEIVALERRRDKTLAIKQGMMQELLTGRTRLT